MPLSIGGLLFEGLDQADFTGPFEVLSRVPDSNFHILAKSLTPVRDARGLVLTPETTLADAPELDVLLVPGGTGVNALLEDEVILEFIRRHSKKMILSVCTGALICGAAGLLRGRRATTHWASHHLLPFFGAEAVDSRVVVDGNIITAAGVTSGIDGALIATSLLRGEEAARQIQLYLEYAPEPPFDSGSPATASEATVEAVRQTMTATLAERAELARRVSVRLGL